MTSPSLSSLPTYQELELGAGYRNLDALWAEVTRPRATPMQQDAGGRARVLASTKAGVVDDNIVLPPVQSSSTSGAGMDVARIKANETSIGEWFAHWQKAGGMNQFGLVPEPFRASYPMNWPKELPDDIRECLLHYLNWTQTVRKK